MPTPEDEEARRRKDQDKRLERKYGPPMKDSDQKKDSPPPGKNKSKDE